MAIVQRRSPPTRRVMRVLEAFATSPTQPLTLTALARQLELDSATCLGILNELTVGGYLVRDDQARTYRLGPVLAGIGRAAGQVDPATEAVRRQLVRLWNDLGVACSASSVVHDEIVVLDEMAPPGASAIVPAGTRFPFQAPSGLMYAIWHADRAVEAWLARGPVALPAEQIVRIWDVIGSSRRSGYLVRRLTNTEMAIRNLLAAQTSHRGHGDQLIPMLAQTLDDVPSTQYLTEELDRSARFAVSWISAPTYNADAFPQYLLGVQVVRADMRGDEIAAITAELLTACAHITDASGGIDPHTDPELMGLLWARTHSTPQPARKRSAVRPRRAGGSA